MDDLFPGWEEREPTRELIQYPVTKTNTKVAAEFDVRGGGTRKEFIENIVHDGQEPWNKWYENRSKTSWVTADFGQVQEIAAFGFKSANDVAKRDPSHVDIFGWFEGQTEMREIASFDLAFKGRWDLQMKELVEGPARVTKLQFNFSNPDYGQMQLGQIQFWGYEWYTESAPVPSPPVPSPPVDPVPAPVVDPVPVEKKGDMIKFPLTKKDTKVAAEHDVRGGGTRKEFIENILTDGQERWNKWYENRSKTSWVTADFGEVRELGAFGFKSANDVPKRDPENVKIFAWFEGETEKREIANFDLAFKGRWDLQMRDLAGPVRVTKVEFNFTNKRYGQMQLGQIQFWGWEEVNSTPATPAAPVDPVPAPVVDPVPVEKKGDMIKFPLTKKDTKVAAEHDVRGGGTRKEFIENILTDGQERWNKWYENRSKTSWVTADFGQVRELGAFGFKSANDVAKRDPQIVKIFAWFEGETEKREIANFDLAFKGRWDLQMRDLAGPVRVTKVEFNFTNKRYGQMQLGQIQFWGWEETNAPATPAAPVDPVPAVVKKPVVRELHSDPVPVEKKGDMIKFPLTKKDTKVTAQHDVRGGGTKKEFVENLLDDGQQNWNKWY